jgi:hypothetical protein
MLMPIRAITTLACAILFVSCDRLSERKLVGTWRSQKGGEGGAVDELAFRADHTLVWWFVPEELSTPQTFVSAGEWHIHGDRIDIEEKPLTSPSPSKHHEFQIQSVSNNTLLLKHLKEGVVGTFVRLDMPACVGPEPGTAPYPIDPNIIGTWQVHFNTHDFKYRFGADHTVAVSARDSGDFQPLWNGTWKVAGSDLIMDLKADKYHSDEKVTWLVHEFQPRCFTIRDRYENSYVVHRLE